MSTRKNTNNTVLTPSIIFFNKSVNFWLKGYDERFFFCQLFEEKKIVSNYLFGLSNIAMKLKLRLNFTLNIR